MLAEHRVDVERAADVVGRIDGADLDMRLVAGGEDRAHVFGRDSRHFGARNGVTGDAATEVAQPASAIARAFTEKVDVRHKFAGVGCTKRADVGNQPAVADAGLDLAADLAGHGDGRVGVCLQRHNRRAIEADLRTRTGDLHDMPDDERFRRRGLGRRSRRFVTAEAADFVEEIAQIGLGLLVHVLGYSHCLAAGIPKSG